MKTLVIGATGSVGKIVAATLEAREHEVIRATRSSSPPVDITNSDSIRQLFEHIGAVDAVVVAAGSVPFRPLAELGPDDYLAAFTGKVLSQIEVVRHGIPHVNDGGSITLTTGILAREPIHTGAAAAMANGAIESFIITAAAEAPRGIRINAVSPNVLANSPGYHSLFPGQRPVSDEEVGRAYTLAVEGFVNGRTIPV